MVTMVTKFITYFTIIHYESIIVLDSVFYYSELWEVYFG